MGNRSNRTDRPARRHGPHRRVNNCADRHAATGANLADARLAELMLAADTTAFAERLGQHSGEPEQRAQLSAHVLDFYDLANRSRHEAADVLLKVLRATDGLWPHGRALRVLLVGFSPLALELTKLKDAEVNVTVLECDRRQFERAELALERGSRLR